MFSQQRHADGRRRRRLVFARGQALEEVEAREARVGGDLWGQDAFLQVAEFLGDIVVAKRQHVHQPAQLDTATEWGKRL